MNYTIDLSDKNAGKLRKVLQPYIAAGSRVGRSAVDGRGGRTDRVLAVGSRSSREQNQAVREWAARNGYEVSERGRLPVSLGGLEKAH